MTKWIAEYIGMNIVQRTERFKKFKREEKK